MTEHLETDSYWLECLAVAPDGTISLQLSGRNAAASWIREHRVPVSEPDYGFWCWILARPEQFPGTFSDELLKKLHDEYRAPI